MLTLGDYMYVLREHYYVLTLGDYKYVLALALLCANTGWLHVCASTGIIMYLHWVITSMC